MCLYLVPLYTPPRTVPPIDLLTRLLIVTLTRILTAATVHALSRTLTYERTHQECAWTNCP